MKRTKGSKVGKKAASMASWIRAIQDSDVDDPLETAPDAFWQMVAEAARRRREQVFAQLGEAAETTIMTMFNPRWPEFLEKLGSTISAEKCDSSTLRLSVRLLRSMDGIDVEKSLAFFRANGGYCDCEVLLNVM